MAELRYTEKENRRDLHLVDTIGHRSTDTIGKGAT